MAVAPRSWTAAPLLVLSLVAPGCRLVSTAVKAPVTVTKAVLPGGKKEEFQRPDASEQQGELMRLAERAVFGLDASSEIAELGAGEEARLEAARWRVEWIQLALNTASRADSIPALLDLIVANRLAVVSFERHLVPDVWAEAAQPVLEAHRKFEQQCWVVGARLMSPEELTQARAVIDDWVAGLGNAEQTTLGDAPSIVEVLERRKDSSGGGLGDLFNLDPFAGLEPTTREIALARLFAERVLFFGKHLPLLTRAQLELAALQMRQQQETEQLLRDVDRISAAAESFGKVADELPELVSSEREAAIRQVSEELGVQREALIRDLETAQPPVSELLESSRATLEAAERTAAGLSSLVAAVDAFVGRFEEPAQAPPPPPREGPEPRPFDITEYTDTAARLGDTARELTTLVAQLEQSLPEVEQMVDVAVRRGEEGLDHALTRGLLVGLTLIAAAAVAALVVRRLGGGRTARA